MFNSTSEFKKYINNYFGRDFEVIGSDNITIHRNDIEKIFYNVRILLNYKLEILKTDKYYLEILELKDSYVRLKVHYMNGQIRKFTLDEKPKKGSYKLTIYNHLLGLDITEFKR